MHRQKCPSADTILSTSSTRPPARCQSSAAVCCRARTRVVPARGLDSDLQLALELVASSSMRSACRRRSSSSFPCLFNRATASSRTVSSIDSLTSPSVTSVRSRLQAARASRSLKKLGPACAIARASSNVHPPAKHAERVVQLFLALAEEAVAPRNGCAQRALPLGKVDRTFHLQGKAFVECCARDSAGARPGVLRRARSPAVARRGGGRSPARMEARPRARRHHELRRARRTASLRRRSERIERENVLAQEPKGSSARREDVETGNEIEQRAMSRAAGRDARGCRGRAACPCLEHVRDLGEQRRARRHRTPRARAIAAGTSAGSADGGEPDQVHRPLERCASGDFECEPALAGATRSGDRHEPRAALRGAPRRGEGVLPARPDDGGAPGGVARQGLQRRELLPDTMGGELEEPNRLRNVLQPVPSEGR